MKKLWMIAIAFLSALYCFAGCSHKDNTGTQSDVSSSTQSSQEGGEDSSLSGDSSQTDSSNSTEDSSTEDSSSSEDSSGEENSSNQSSDSELDTVPPITNGGNFDGTE